MLYYVYNNDVGINKDVTSIGHGVGGWTEISYDGGTTWSSINNNILRADTSERFRAAFSLRSTNATSVEPWYGYSISPYGYLHPIANIAGRKYLVVCDVRNSGAALKNTRLAAYNPSASTMTFPSTANQTAYTRVYGVFSGDTARCFIDAYANATGTSIRLDVKNWRQFDVTGWTDAQITALATKENYDEVYLQLPTTFKGEANMTPEKFVAMGGIIRNDDVDIVFGVNEIPLNYTFLA